MQLDLRGSASVPADAFSRAAPLPPGQAAVRMPQLSVSLVCQLEGAFFTGRLPARTWMRQRNGNRTLGRAGRWIRRGIGAGLRFTGRRRRWRRKRVNLQHLLQLAFQQHLILRHHIQQGRYAFVHRQHILGAGAGLRPRQGAQNVLQLLTFGVNNMAQSKLFHGDGSDDHRQGFFLRQVRPVWGKRRHRHMRYSIARPGSKPGRVCAAGKPLPPFHPMRLEPSCDTGTRRLTEA